jgi:hypothetical protein
MEEKKVKPKSKEQLAKEAMDKTLSYVADINKAVKEGFVIPIKDKFVDVHASALKYIKLHSEKKPKPDSK